MAVIIYVIVIDQYVSDYEWHYLLHAEVCLWLLHLNMDIGKQVLLRSSFYLKQLSHLCPACFCGCDITLVAI